MSEEKLKKEMEELVKNKMDTFIECYKNGMIFGSPTDIEFYEKIATLQQKVEQLENIRKEAIEYIHEHQLVFELSSKKQIQYWFDEFYRDLLNILNKGGNKQ